MNKVCVSCREQISDKNTIGINKKLLGEKTTNYFCIECLAAYLETSIDDIYEKIEEFKDEGCIL